MLGRNIKVHFAGTEQSEFAHCCSKGGVKYFLFTVFPFISQQFGIKGYPITQRHFFAPNELKKLSKHTIMDSGLFTLMFGAHAGNRDKAFLLRWQEALCNFVNTNKVDATCVEVDCQKILGVEEAWEFRKKLRDMLPNNRQINVFHIPDGRKGLDRLIEFSEYIAISVPELRIAKRKTYKEDVYRLASFIKNKKPEIDIHLLGCTEQGLLSKCNFCTSADSTAWQTVNRFGTIQGYHVSQLDKELLKKCSKDACDVLNYFGIEKTEKRKIYYTNYVAAATILKKLYASWAGSQD